MAEDYLEFSVLSDRKYTRNHLWMQIVDKEEGTWKIGVSDCLIQEMGDILRVVMAVLPSDALADNAAADNEFDFADVAEEFSEGDVLFSIWSQMILIQKAGFCSSTHTISMRISCSPLTNTLNISLPSNQGQFESGQDSGSVFFQSSTSSNASTSSGLSKSCSI